MIWSNDNKILFLHVPKAAGMSMTKLLLEQLNGQVHITGQDHSNQTNVKCWPGKRHENLYDAESFLAYRGKSIFSFERIFVVMRNPYDLELSRYHYLRLGHAVDVGPAQKIAMSESFEKYLEKSPFFAMNPPRLDMYYSIANSIPENLVVLKFENLINDIRFKLSPYLRNEPKLGKENSTSHKKYQSVYNKDSEELCYNRHRWFFDKGFYSREFFDS